MYKFRNRLAFFVKSDVRKKIARQDLENAIRLSDLLILFWIYQRKGWKTRARKRSSNEDLVKETVKETELFAQKLHLLCSKHKY